MQRFLALCRQETAAPPIRVLIYGQSITGQPWTARVIQRLQAQFPTRQWEVVNRCIDGHGAEFLEKTAEADLFPFEPDLLIFHAFGDTNAYTRLVRSVRARTVADILLVGNTYTLRDSLADPNPGEWDGITLPALAQETGACHADVRTAWRAHLLKVGRSIQWYLLDDVHPNAQGQALLEAIVFRQFSIPGSVPLPNPYRDGRVRRFSTTDPWHGVPVEAAVAGSWTRPESYLAAPQIPVSSSVPSIGAERILRFYGNGLVARISGRQGEVAFEIDGQPPSAHARGVVHGRTSTWPGGRWPFLLRVTSVNPPVPEEWRLRILSVEGPRALRFNVTGSTTGEDGEGHSSEVFESRSGRVRIDPEDWYWTRLYTTPVKGDEYFWTSVETGTDRILNPRDRHSDWVRVAGGLPTGWHDLRLIENGPNSVVDEVLVLDPSGREAGNPGTVHRTGALGGFWLTGRGILESSMDLHSWKRDGVEMGAGRSAVWMPVADGPAGFYRVVPGESNHPAEPEIGMTEGWNEPGSPTAVVRGRSDN